MELLQHLKWKPHTRSSRLIFTYNRTCPQLTRHLWRLTLRPLDIQTYDLAATSWSKASFRSNMSTVNPSSPIVRFYDPSICAKDSQHRSLSAILQWNDDRLEYSHDYIQWLFPLPERSPIAPSAPTIDSQTFSAFRSRSELRGRLRDALERICQFYGFKFISCSSNKSGQIQRLPEHEFGARCSIWVSRFNHNHLRITRIIRCLRVLGLEEEAALFFEAVENVYHDTGRIGPRSLMFWRRAMERPLYIAPEDEEDEGTGQGFLHEYEEERARSTGVASSESHNGMGQDNPAV